jgi:hypothetical protein
MTPRRKGWTIQCIRAAVASGRIGQVFSPKEVNDACGITYAGTFLPKHRIGNPGSNTEHFVCVSESPALYRLAI